MALFRSIPLSHYDLIDQFNVPEVQSLARVLSYTFPMEIDPRALPKHKADCIRLILSTLASEANLARAFAALTENEQHTISIILDNPELVLDAKRYVAIYGVRPATPRTAYGAGKMTLLNAFVSTDQSIPPELAKRLRPLAPKLKEPGASYLAGDLPVKDELWLHATEQAACHDVLAVLNLIDQKAVKVSGATRSITDTGAEALLPALLAGDYYADEFPEWAEDVEIGPRGIKPFAWALLVQAAGLATVSAGKLALTAAGMKARTKPPQETLRTIWNRWLKHADFHEFSRLEEIKGQKSARHPLTKPNDARQAIGNTLARLEVNRWITIDNFFTFMFAINEDFSVVRNAWALYHGHAEYGSFGYSHITWKHLDGRFAMAFLLEYCATLGIIDVGIGLPWGARKDMRGLWGWDEQTCISRYDGLHNLRLTPLGAWVLGAADEYLPRRISARALQILPNLDVVLSHTPEPAVLIQLERIAGQTADNVYRLAREKILDACEDGVALADILNFLTDQTDDELPHAARALFREIEEGLAKFTLKSSGYLIHCTDPGLISQVTHDPAFSRWCTAVDDRHFYLREGNEKAFRAALKKMGYLIQGLK